MTDTIGMDALRQAFLDGVNLEALAGDYADLTGRTLPIPAPPAPTPPPTPAPAGCVVAALPVLALVGALAFR